MEINGWFSGCLVQACPWIDGKYIYSLDDCRCEFCLYVDAGTGRCHAAECCCVEEIDQAPQHFPPDGYEQRKRCAPCRG